MFSMVTVASSTRMPTASAKPPRVMMLMVSCRALSTMTEARIDSGIEMPMIRVLRQLPRKSRIMRPDETGGDDGFADDAADGGADEDGLIGERLNLELRRERGRNAQQQIFDALHHVERGRAAGFQDAD